MRERGGGLGVLSIFVAAVPIFGGCVPSKVTTAASPAIGQYHVRTVVVMPFDRLETPQILDSPSPELSVPRGARRSDISLMAPPPSPGRLDTTTAVVPESAPDQITRMMFDQLHKREDLRVFSPEEAKTAMKSRGTRTASLSSEQVAREVVARLGTDAALLGRVLVYRERDGSKWGANPAIVGFEVTLIGVDGQTLWTANYYEKQRPLIEDVKGFFERGGVFVTAEELAKYGAERIAREFPFGRQ